MNAIDFLTFSLATLRLAYAITSEDGPFEIFAHWRGYLTKLEVERKEQVWWVDGFFCILCTSFEVGLILGLLFLFKPKIARAVALPLSLSALTLVLRHNKLI